MVQPKTALEAARVAARHDFSKARKGDLALVEMRHSATAMHGATTATVDYVLALVAKTNRAGVAVEFTAWHGGPLNTGRNLPRCWIVGGDKLNGVAPADIVRALGEHSFATIDAARVVLREFIGGEA